MRALRVGTRLTECIYDSTGVLLLAAGSEITARFLSQLSQRNITSVRLQAPADQSADCSGKLEDESQSADTPSGQASRSPAGRRAKSRVQLSLEDLAAAASAGLEKHSAASGRLKSAAPALANGDAVSAAEFSGVVADFANMVTLDRDLLLTVEAMQVGQEEYLFDHCVNTSLLSMALGNELGFPQERVIELGMATLLSDVGMLRVPDEIRLARRSLTAFERSEIERHPCHTLDCLQQMDGLPESVPWVGYQIHERMDGSGYPQGRSRFLIHEYARVAAVADTYTALCHDRPHRPGFLPYLAAKTILSECSQGKFDPAIVRKFLDHIGLFPVRSYVQLNSGVKAVVIRTNPGLHTRPVVAEVDQNGAPGKTVIDLSQESNLHVERAVPA